MIPATTYRSETKTSKAYKRRYIEERERDIEERERDREEREREA